MMGAGVCVRALARTASQSLTYLGVPRQSRVSVACAAGDARHALVVLSLSAAAAVCHNGYRVPLSPHSHQSA